MVCAPALACDYPDEGNMPVRRAVAKVRYLPEAEAWAASMHEEGVIVHYALLLDAPVKTADACYWPLDVSAGGKLWRRYYVTPDGERVTRDPPVASGPK